MAQSKDFIRLVLTEAETQRTAAIAAFADPSSELNLELSILNKVIELMKSVF